MTIGHEAYVAAARDAVERVAAESPAGVHEAAGLVTSALRAGGVLQAFGSGHSEAFALEIVGRAGGLVPTNQLALRDVVIYGEEKPDVLFDSHLERDPHVAHRLYELAPVQPEDVFLIASNSGVNGSVVELARIVKDNGHPLIAVTSLEHSGGVPSRHPSERKLKDLADVVLDNGAPHGDAILPLPSGGGACAVSSITAALLAQMLNAEIVRRLLHDGETPPVYQSANVPGGDEHNKMWEQRYAGRIRRAA